MTDSPPLSADARRFVAVGEALCGKRWIRPFAKLLGVSPILVSYVASGQRSATAELMAKIEVAFSARERELNAEIDRVRNARALHQRLLQLAGPAPIPSRRRDVEPDDGGPAPSM